MGILYVVFVVMIVAIVASLFAGRQFSVSYGRSLQALGSIPGIQSTETRFCRIVGLHVEGNGFGDGELVRLLAAVDSIQEIQLDHTAITSIGLARLQQCRKLHTVWLYDEILGDSAVAEICRVKGLRTLGIRLPRLTGNGLRCLVDLSNLEYLRIEGGTVTNEQLTVLRRAIPKCDVVYESE